MEKNISTNNLNITEYKSDKEFCKEIKTIDPNNIPIELWYKIGDYLSDVDRLKLTGISKYLDSIINSSYFNERKWLKCFYLKENYNNENLGYPLEVNIFRESSSLKSIESSLDIVSFKAYNE